METDVLSLKPSEAAKAITALIQRREPHMLIGPPGLGKTSLVDQACAAIGADIIVSHPVVDDPTDAKGIPWIDKDHEYAFFKPFHNIYRALNATKETVYFLDDLGQAPPTVQAAWMGAILRREVDGKKLPAHLTFIAATNRRTDKAGVSGILEPVKGRFTLLHLRSDLDDFCNNLFARGKSEYGLDENAITMGAAFLRFRPELLNQFSPTADMTNTPTERNWVSAFGHTVMAMPKHIEHALIAGRVGTGAATEFTAFLGIYRSMPSLDVIMADPSHAPIPKELAARYAVAVGLAAKANEANFEKIRVYGERLEKEALGEFAVLMCRDAIRRCPKIGSTRAWIELASGSVGKLMQGRGE